MMEQYVFCIFAEEQDNSSDDDSVMPSGWECNIDNIQPIKKKD